MRPKEDDIAAVRKLRQYIASLDFGNDDLVKAHKDIYTYINQTILAPQSTILNIVPPVDVLAYAAKNILFPTLAQDLMPQLLDVIATVEFYRQRTLAQAKNALEWKGYYKNEGDPKADPKADALSSNEEAFLKQLNVSGESWRTVYVTILCKCCHFDLYHLWIVNPPSMANFMIRFNEYFPFLNKHCTHESPRLLHQTLSPDERGKLSQTGLTICAFCSDLAQWVTDNTRDDEPFWTLFDTEEFKKAFPPPCAARHLVKLICKYLDYVVSIVLKVEGVLRDRRN